MKLKMKSKKELEQIGDIHPAFIERNAGKTITVTEIYAKEFSGWITPEFVEETNG